MDNYNNLNYMDIETSKVLIALIAFLSGAAISIPITVRVVRKKNSNRVNQSGNVVGGSMAGRDNN